MSFVGPEHTSRDWQLHETKMVVWSIGACEQHGHHLPLETDTIQAEHFARYVAKDLGAALIPTMPFGTSMEHKGFRGTISLSPDVLIALVRQVVAELEAQSFTRLILVNGHGGNFSLFPCIREINRADRSIKIIVVNPWEFRAQKGQAEVHAGEMETSIMLALGADVGDDRRDSDPFAVGYLQSDLNTFGVGRLSKTGTWGFPSKASKAKGERMLKSVYKNMMSFVRERLKRLDQDPRYGGPGPVALRTMTSSDLDFALSLSRTANWNQTIQDWRLYLDLCKESSFIAMHNGNKAGTVTCVHYQDRFSWIGMVLVDPVIRRAGVGTALLNQAIETCTGKGVAALDATPEGRALYLTLGFSDYCHLSRMVADSCSDILTKPSLACESMKESDLKKVIAYDEKIFGANRKTVLRHLYVHNKRYAYVFKRGAQICGYCLGRSGHEYEQIGPIVADDLEIAQSLLVSSLRMSRKKSVLIDCVNDQDDFYQLLEGLGFTLQRPFIRMFKGKVPKGISMLNQYAISGPELG